MKETLRKRWNNIMHLWCSGYLDTVPDSFRNNYAPFEFKKKVGIIVKDLTADILRFFIYKKIPKNKIWCLVLTKNNFDSLKNIKSQLPETIYISYYRFRSRIPDSNVYYFSLPLKVFQDLLYPFRLLLYYTLEKKKTNQYYDLLFSVNGSYSECYRIIKRNKPKAIIFSNDHLVISRALLLAANDLRINTYYIQHASISKYFPPLEFTYSLLEGQDSLDKYTKCSNGNIDSIIYLVGMSKFDDYSDQKNKKEKIENLGIAFNLVDSVNDVYETAISIKKAYPNLKIVVRPHPADRRDFSLFKRTDLEWSDPNEEDAFKFLIGIDGLIAGDSNIHLEATLLNITSIYYKYDGVQSDYYGFVKNGLIDSSKNIAELHQKLGQLGRLKNNTSHRALYYNAAINSSFEGKSTNRIVEIITKTLANDSKYNIE